MTSRVPSGAPRLSTMPSSSNNSNSNKARQLSHLHSQLAQLSANFADLENLISTTSVQAERIRELGAYHGALFMSASKVLGEETIAGQVAAQQRQQQRGSGGER